MAGNFWGLWEKEKKNRVLRSASYTCSRLKNLGEKLVKMLGFCQNWIFGQKFDFSNSVCLKHSLLVETNLKCMLQRKSDETRPGLGISLACSKNLSPGKCTPSCTSRIHSLKRTSGSWQVRQCWINESAKLSPLNSTSNSKTMWGIKEILYSLAQR